MFKLVNFLMGFSIVPLFIGKENMRRKPKRAVGDRPRKRQIKNQPLGKNTEGNPSVGRPSTVRFSTVGVSARLIGRPFIPTREQSFLLVDRVSRSYPTESKALAVGRPKCTQCTSKKSCAYPSGPPTEQFCSVYGRSVGRPIKGQKHILKIILKSIFF